MEDQLVAHGGHQLGYRGCVTGMSSDGGSDPGWDQHSHVESTGVLRLAFPKFQRHARRDQMGVVASPVGSSLAVVEVLVRLGDH